MDEEYKGHCLWGSVQLEGRGAPGRAVIFEACASVMTGQNDISVYERSSFAQRAFFKTCATTLYDKLMGEHVPCNNVETALFDPPKGFSIRGEIFMDEQPDHDRFDTDKPRFARAEMMKRLDAYLAKQEQQ
ncbi:MAG: hypothetical protein AAF829_09465 [Pseudomonadota bacterium]